MGDARLLACQNGAVRLSLALDGCLQRKDSSGLHAVVQQCDALLGEYSTCMFRHQILMTQAYTHVLLGEVSSAHEVFAQFDREAAEKWQDYPNIKPIYDALNTCGTDHEALRLFGIALFHLLTGNQKNLAVKIAQGRDRATCQAVLRLYDELEKGRKEWSADREFRQLPLHAGQRHGDVVPAALAQGGLHQGQGGFFQVWFAGGGR